MILDKLTEFCGPTALGTAGTGKQLVGNVVDTGAIVRDLGVGTRLYFIVLVTAAVTSGGAATVIFILASDAQAAIATDGSATVHYQTAAIPKATLVAGYRACAVAIPQSNPAYEEFLGVLADVGTAALTAGSIEAFLTETPDAWTSYAAGTTV